MRLTIEGLMASPGFKRREDALTAIAPSGSFSPYMDGVLLMFEGSSLGGVEVHPGGCMYSDIGPWNPDGGLPDETNN